MDFRQVQLFLAVATTGSFSAAADELYLTQSLISKQIIALEKNSAYFSLIEANEKLH